MSNSVTIIFTTGCALFLVHSAVQVNVNRNYDARYLLEPQCTDSNDVLCENVVSYPHDNLKQILNERNAILPMAVSEQYKQEEDYEDSICGTVVRYIRPESGVTVNDIPMFILNIETEYIQEVRVAKCIGRNLTCNNVVNSSGHGSQCQQSYTYQRLVAFDSFYKTSTELFKIPSGCCCMTKTDKDTDTDTDWIIALE